MITAQNIAVYCFLAISIIILLFAVIVLWKIWNGTISLDGLIAESPSQGQPSHGPRMS
jgi:hypothetical protein